MTSKRKRVLHLIDSGGVYGAESVILNLSREMEASGDWEPVIGCIVSGPSEPNDLYETAKANGLSAEKLVIRNFLLAWDLPRTAIRLKKMGINLIHSHGYKPSVFGFLMGKLSWIPVMATCHLWFKGEKRPLKMRLMIFLELLFYRKFKVVVGVSEAIRDVLLDSRVDPDRVLVIPNGVPIIQVAEEERRRAGDLRTLLGVAPNELGVINTGRLTRQKAQKTIIQAAALLKKSEVRCRFFIVGEGSLKDELLAQIVDHGVEDRVELLGFRQDVRELLLAMDLFVLPSLDEGMPISLLEAAAVGIPVICTAVGDIPKLIENMESGLIVPVEDPEALARAIGELGKDKELGTALAREARAVLAREYSEERMWQHYAKVYATF